MAFRNGFRKKNSDKVKKNQTRKQINNRRTNLKSLPKQWKQEDNEIDEIKSRYVSIESSNITSFLDFPLSGKTQKGLQENNYRIPTEIQKQSIGYALQGRDVLGAAITGSGKTLAFLVPIVEQLFTKKWSRVDGIGAIIISPTRELAYQIFETLKKVGAHHDFSAGLIIGGKNLKFERSRMDQCNIVICTPGRLLQHMDENPLFNCSSMQILVLDEADRCLDMGFEQTMNGIIENLPPERQTLLFSATQTKSVKDLARLSLTEPVYVAPHEQSAHSTPDALKQSYVIVNLEDKITMIWSFIKNHLKQKCIVFLSTCKQVKYIYEIFCKLRPGTSLLALYGTLHQDRRMAIYNDFCRKSNAILFATDVASRGLDFPIVNWVIQLDCPEDATAYIHRAGRTARHTARGESLLVLMPSEQEGMLDELVGRKIPINQISIDTKKLFSPRVKMEAFLAQNQQLKESAQRAFVAYIKSVVLMRNKEIFNIDRLDTDAFAHSLGLVVSPRLRFLQRLKKNREQNRKKQQNVDESTNSSDEEEDNESENKSNDKQTEKLNFHLSTDSEGSDNESENDTFLKVKRKDHEIPHEPISNESIVILEKPERKPVSKKPLTKVSLAKRVIKKKISANRKVIYDESGEQVIDTAKTLQSLLGREMETSADGEGGIDIEKAKELLREEDKFDKQRFHKMIKAKHKESKKKLNKKKVDDEIRDDFGSDSESEGPDMSWLPDPKKIYTDRAVVNSDSDTSDNESDQFHRAPKRLLTNDDLEVPSTTKRKKITEKLTVDEAEQLAMQLLGQG